MAFFQSLYNASSMRYTIYMHILRKLKKLFIKFPLHGHLTQTGFSHTQSALKESKVGDRLQIVRPINEPCAYAYSVELNALLGKIDRPLTKRLSGLFGKCFCLDAKLAVKTGGLPYNSYGGIVEIYDTTTFMSETDDFSFLHN